MGTGKAVESRVAEWGMEYEGERGEEGGQFSCAVIASTAVTLLPIRLADISATTPLFSFSSCCCDQQRNLRKEEEEE